MGKSCSSFYTDFMGPNCHRSSAWNLNGTIFSTLKLILYVEFSVFFFSYRKKHNLYVKGRTIVSLK